MYFRVNLKMKKPKLCCCFTWTVFIELNCTVTFLLIRKTWDDQLVWGIFRNGGILLMEWMILKWGLGGDTPLWTMGTKKKSENK